MIEVIAFDGDDTLWHNESIFFMTQERFRRLVAPYVPSADPVALDDRLFATQMANLGLFGYGVKAFVLSMIETAIQLSGGTISGTDIQCIIDAGKDMLSHPVQLLDGAADTIDALAGRYRLMLITKGDLFDQESKLARSGLGDRFWRVAVVSAKDVPTYQRVLGYHGVDPATLLMVGNSVPSDILPVLEIGASAVHIPYHLTWAHEIGEPVEGRDRLWNLNSIGEVPVLVERLSAGGFG